MFPDSDTGSGDEWIDIADAQSDTNTNTEPVSNDINSAGNDIHDSLESEAEGYETDSEDNDIHSESRAAASEDCTSESSESERELHVSEKPQFTEDRKGNMTAAASCKDENSNKRFQHLSHNTKAPCRKKLSKHTNGGGERREDKLSKDELAQLLKQRKERAAIIGQTRVCVGRGRECV